MTHDDPHLARKVCSIGTIAELESFRAQLVSERRLTADAISAIEEQRKSITKNHPHSQRRRP